MIDPIDRRLAELEARVKDDGGTTPKSFERKLAESVHWAIAKSTAPLQARVDELTARVQQLEARPVLKDAGAWQPGAAFLEGDIVSHGGSGWICSEAHIAAESIDHNRFRLLVKRGRDGRDGRGR